MKTLIIDNFDSFTYNLYQYVAELGGNPVVVRNNEISLADIKTGGFSHIIISPGPGSPDKKKDFGMCGEVIKKLAPTLPILGVCLGHQGIIHFLGGRVVRAPEPVHGKRSVVVNSEQRTVNRTTRAGAEKDVCTYKSILEDLPETFEVMRYHSLIGEKKSMPRELVITAETVKDGLVMAVQHTKFPLYGVQFHPESIGTPEGKKILANFLKTENGERKVKNSSEKEAEELVLKMARSEMSEEEMAAVLKEIAARGETVEEIAGMARGMRKCATKISIKNTVLMDTCGTGGSGLQRMNISTTAAFVLAACGVKIAKHGNRAASGRCGSFDLLEALGVPIELDASSVSAAIKQTGIGFIFAPLFHPAMKVIGPVRKKLGIRTIFNVLGPLTNPAFPKYHLLGTPSREVGEKIIRAMKKLGYTNATIVSGENGLDDVTLTGKTYVQELKNGKIRSYEFSPKEVGMKTVKDFSEIAGGSAHENADLFIALLKRRAAASLQNMLLLNAGFALYTCDAAKTMRDGVELASRAIESGAAYRKFLEYKTFALSSRSAA